MRRCILCTIYFFIFLTFNNSFFNFSVIFQDSGSMCDSILKNKIKKGNAQTERWIHANRMESVTIQIVRTKVLLHPQRLNENFALKTKCFPTWIGTICSDSSFKFLRRRKLSITCCTQSWCFPNGILCKGLSLIFYVA